MNRTTATMRVIAEQCEVSRSTVSLALRGDPRISAGVIERVTKAAYALGYTPDPKVAEVMRSIATKEKTLKNSLGLLVGAFFERPDPWKSYPWFENYYRALTYRAAEHGYGLATFWLGEPGMSSRRMKQILLARGIEGLVVIDRPEVTSYLDFDFGLFAATAIGRGLARCGLDTVGCNLHDDATRALAEIARKGYQNPGLALDAECCESNLLAWRSAYCYDASLAHRRAEIPVCIYDRNDLQSLAAWYFQHKPDAVLGLPWSTFQDLKSLGIALPSDAGFATMYRDERFQEAAGMRLPFTAIAEKAIDVVADKLRHYQKGVPTKPQLVLYDGVWEDGPSLPDYHLTARQNLACVGA